MLTEEKHLDMMFYWNTDKMCKALEVGPEERDAMLADITARYFADEQ